MLKYGPRLRSGRTDSTGSVHAERSRGQLEEPLTRAEFERFSQPLLDELEACTDELLARTPRSLKIDSVFLTGGSSQIPAVRALFARKFGEDRLRTADAFTSVAEGLGRAADAAFQLSAET